MKDELQEHLKGLDRLAEKEEEEGNEGRAQGLRNQAQRDHTLFMQGLGDDWYKY